MMVFVSVPLIGIVVDFFHMSISGLGSVTACNSWIRSSAKPHLMRPILSSWFRWNNTKSMLLHRVAFVLLKGSKCSMTTFEVNTFLVSLIWIPCSSNQSHIAPWWPLWLTLSYWLWSRLSSSSPIWKYPLTTSTLGNLLASVEMDSGFSVSLGDENIAGEIQFDGLFMIPSLRTWSIAS